MKKIVLSALLTIGSNTLIAGELGSTQKNPITPFKGSYLGVGVGGVFPFYNTQGQTLVTARLPYLSAVNGSSNASSNNVFGNIFLGYGFLFNSLYLAPEVYFNAGRRPTASLAAQAVNSYPNELLSTNTKAKLNAWEEGVDARLGWLVSPNTLPFIRLGAAFNTLKLSSNTTAYTEGSITPETKLLNYSGSKSFVGFRAGAGLEQKLTSRVSVRADYIYTYYGNFSMQSSNHIGPLGPIINTTQVHLQSQAVMGSIIYDFSA